MKFRAFRCSTSKYALTCIAFAWLVVDGPMARAQVATKMEALAGAPAPGTPIGFVWSAFTGVTISNDGELTFVAGLFDQPNNKIEGSGIWRGSRGQFALVVRTGDAAPGAGPGATFDTFSNLATRGTDSMDKPLAFTASVLTGATSRNSIWAIPDVTTGTLVKVAMEGDAAPAGGTYDDLIQARSVPVGFDGSVAFTAFADNQSVIYRFYPNFAIDVAINGDPIPGLGMGKFQFGRLLSPTISDEGVLLFRTGIQDGGIAADTDFISSALIAQSTGLPSVRYLSGSATNVPGINFHFFGEPDAVPGDKEAFYAFLRPSSPSGTGVDLTNNTGIFLGRDIVARKGEPAPDSPSGERFGNFFDYVAGNSSEVVFTAQLVDTSNNRRTGLFVAGPIGFPAKIGYENEQAPGTPAGVVFGAFGSSVGVYNEFNQFQINSRGQIAFKAACAAPGAPSTVGLWGTALDSTLLLVARVGDQIEVAPGDRRTVTGITFLGGNGLPAGPGDGRPKALNDAGQVVFSVDFSDGTSGIVRATLPGSGSTSANYLESVNSNDPVNTRVGELVASEVDLNLGGPMPLTFARYYAARLASDRTPLGPLGPNWLSNFDAILTVNGDTAQVVTNEGRVMSFTRANNVWALAGPLDIPFQLAQLNADFILADPRGQRMWTFSADGRLMKIEDGRGNSHALIRNAGGRLTSVDDGLGRTLTFSYNADGTLAGVTNGTRLVQYGYDASGTLASVTDPLNHTTQYAYSAGSLLSARTLPRGNVPITQTFSGKAVASQIEHGAGGDQTTAFTYDSSARATTITDPLANRRVHAYAPTGELGRFTDEENKSIVIGSDAVGRRTTVTDRLGRTTTIAYHEPSGKPASITTPDGARTVFDYQPRTVAAITFYDLVKITRADGTTQTFTYDARGNVLTATDALATVTTFTHDAHGRILTARGPTGDIATFSYDAAENLASSKESDTGVTTYAYDALNRLTRITHPDGTHADIVYDADDRLISVTDERGKTTAFAYDINDNVIAVTDAANVSAQFSYDALDRLVQITDRLGKTSGVAFDSRGLLAAVTDALGHATVFAHDTRRRTSAIADAGNATTTFGHNDEAELTSVTDPLGHTTTFVRNPRGRIVAVTDPLGRTRQIVRDALQRVTSVVDVLGRQTAFTYDARGALTTAHRDGIGAASYRRDAAGRITQIHDPNQAAWNYSYTAGGRLAASQDPLGRTTGFTYDTRGRVATIALPEGGSCAVEYDGASDVTRLNYSSGPDLLFVYDDLRRLISANDVTLAYDAEGRIVSSTQTGQTFGATYDAAGRLITASYANGALIVTYGYDARDRLVSVSDSLSGASIAFLYDDASRLTTVTRGNGVNATFTYDDANRLTRILEGSIPPIDLKFTRNAAGDITATDYSAPQLPAVQAAALAFEFDEASQLVGTGFSHDARGRVTSVPGRDGQPAHTFMWDGASRLIELDGVRFHYNGFGEILERATGPVATPAISQRYYHHHALARSPIVAEHDLIGGQFKRYYIYTPGGALLYTVDAATNAPIYYHFDQVGSTLALTDASGAVTDAYAYSPYGEILGRTGTNTQPFTFVGAFGVRSEQAFFQMRARYYDPTTARFLSRDTGRARLADPRTLDPYLYAMGNPTRYVDPAGTDPEQIDGTAIAAQSGLFGKLTKGEQENAFQEGKAFIAGGVGTDDATVGFIFGAGLGLSRAPEAGEVVTTVEQPVLEAAEAFNTPPRPNVESFEEIEALAAQMAALNALTKPADAARFEDSTADPSPVRAESSGKAAELIADALQTTGGTVSTASASLSRGLNTSAAADSRPSADPAAHVAHAIADEALRRQTQRINHAAEQSVW